MLGAAMKAAALVVSATSTVLFLVGCEPESKPPVKPKPHAAQTGVSPTPTPGEPTPAPSATPEAEASPSPSPEAATPAPSPTPSTTGTIPYGIPVPGKPGFVTSPYAPGSGYIDVRGFPPNSEAKDPYSGKIFRVP
jgi:hypothetical protein